MDLLILPFDHRSSFSKDILGVEGIPESAQVQEIKRLKKLVFQAFLKVRDSIEKPEELGILVDEMYGSEILNEANRLGITTIVGAEKSGQTIFDFEYGKKFGKHIEDLNPKYVKVLVRYNPENTKINKKQLKRLKKLSEYCQKKNRKLLFELLVPPTETNKSSDRDFETEIRPEKTVQAIIEIAEKVKVSIWKLEGFSKEGWEQVLEVIPEDEKIIVLGRGEDKEKVNFWLQEAAQFNHIIGFAIGRTIFLHPLLDHLRNNVSQEDTVTKIAENYLEFVNLWRSLRTPNIQKTQ